MKLVEILARELKEWPNDWPAVGQAKDGSLHREPFLGGHTEFKLTRAKDYVQAIVTRAQWQEAREALSKPANFAEPNWNEAPEGFDYFIQWPHKAMRGNFYRIEGDRYVRDNGYYASVKEVHDDSDIIVTKRPIVISDKPWSGEGLPPVGTVCEIFAPYTPHESWASHVGKQATIIAHDSAMAVYRIDGDDGLIYHALGSGWNSKEYPFRPIRTPEQIAAEERSEFSRAMCKDAGHESPTRGQLAMAEMLYDAGYRKVNDGNQKA